MKEGAGLTELEWFLQKWEAGERESLLVSRWKEELQEEPHAQWPPVCGQEGDDMDASATGRVLF